MRVAGVDETIRRGEGAAAAAVRLAREKALAVSRGARARPAPGAIVLGADTIVAIDRTILGKPRDAEDARRMLRMLAGRTHRVVTGIAVCAARTNRVRSVCAVTHVTFRRLGRDEIDWYVETGEPADKAGAYGIQGRASLFITGIRGSWTNVVGLPMDRVAHLIGLPRGPGHRRGARPDRGSLRG